MITRRKELISLRRLLAQNPVVGIIGARQVGKTTLAQMYTRQSREPHHYFDLENPEDEARLGDPLLALKELKGLVVIDEIQRLPGLTNATFGGLMPGASWTSLSSEDG